MRKLILAAGAAVLLTGCVVVVADGTRTVIVEGASDAPRAAGDASWGDVYLEAIEDPRRPADEVARDAARKPYDMMAFAGVNRGQRIADIRPEEGYFTRLFAPVVGDGGRVYAFVPTRTATRETPLAQGLAATYPNVVAMEGALDSMTFPEPLDAVFMVQEYHDFHIPAFGVDVTRMNKAVYDALKPGGYYIVIDHAGRPGTGNTEVQSLHRIEGEFLVREVEAAGFVLDGESDAIRNPADDGTINVFDERIRYRTDQFVYRFRKPG
ncbi:MAG: lipoprotein [Alphaproteobacteria bacterium]|nr:lipoprotein [Alphaproteobacteria bacterium]MBU1525745.1 lipoprotein [Alphaproteobacteria bacterium]MBU2351874.1 lipoprotein [Alphaproteobacteria bacterium]MBU2382728.1 lipoprotein [Alphaproteobacteria bacterium]